MTARPEITIGSKRFTESYILGEILRETAQAAGEAHAVHMRGLGNTGIVFGALASGSIDAYPDYTGTVAREILKLDTVPSIAELNARLAPMRLGIGVPLGFNNTYALAMRSEAAQRQGIRTLSDLARHRDLRLGLSQEFLGRADGWAGLKRAYDLPFAAPRGLDHGLAYEALAAGQVDVIDVYATDAKIGRYGLVVLADDRSFFPRYDAVLVYRSDLPQRLPKTWAALEHLQGRLGDATMVRLNGEAELARRDFAAIATDFLRPLLAGKAEPKPEVGFAHKLFGPDFARLLREHVLLVFVSLAASCVVGIPLGMLAARRRGASAAILGAAGVIQTIPLARLARLPDPGVQPHRRVAGFLRPGPLRAAAHRAQHRYWSRPGAGRTRAGRGGAGAAAARHPRLHRAAACAADHHCGHQDFGGDQCRYRHYRCVHRRGRFRRAHRHRARAQRSRHTAGRRDPGRCPGAGGGVGLRGDRTLAHSRAAARRAKLATTRLGLGLRKELEPASQPAAHHAFRVHDVLAGQAFHQLVV